jgi:hypothetical protein
MKLRDLFTINIFFAAFFGTSCTLFPEWVIGLYGLSSNDAAVWTTRLVGGSILCFVTLLWFGRTSADSNARRAIALALFVNDAVGTLASLEVQLRGSANAFGWSNPILYVLLALGYAYFLFMRPQNI